MLSVVQGLSEYSKVPECIIDGAVMQLHYSFTVIALLTFFVISTTRQFVGDPIDCVYDKENVPANVMNTFCWTHTTYTVPFSTNSTVTGHPGIGPDEDSSTFRYHTYYQWVYFVLLLQAGLFYFPRWVWLQWEGGKVKALKEGLTVAVMKEEEKESKVDIVLDYIMSTWRRHDWYPRRYVICESMAIINIIVQFLLLDWFFQGDYLKLGINIMRYSMHKVGVPPLYKLFPTVTMCKFNMFGASAAVEVVAALCIMPLNVLNEKIYIFLWFWFVILFFMSATSIAFDVAVLMSPKLRLRIMRRIFAFVDAECVETLVKEGGCGDWYLVYLLGRNVDFVVFKDLMQKLLSRLNSDECKQV